MRVLVTGGRSYNDWEAVCEHLTSLRPTVVIQGGANGADCMARRWAQANNVPIITYEANWGLGPTAGPIRNNFMLVDSMADLVLAFPGGRGTADMVRRAKAAKVTVKEAV